MEGTMVKASPKIDTNFMIIFIRILFLCFCEYAVNYIYSEFKEVKNNNNNNEKT